MELCGGGIVFLRGAAGTVQEIFQDACENYYSAAEAVTPMASRIFLVDTVEEAIAVLG